VHQLGWEVLILGKSIDSTCGEPKFIFWKISGTPTDVKFSLSPLWLSSNQVFSLLKLFGAHWGVRLAKAHLFYFIGTKISSFHYSRYFFLQIEEVWVDSQKTVLHLIKMHKAFTSLILFIGTCFWWYLQQLFSEQVW
jgi:hypothetical protein